MRLSAVMRQATAVHPLGSFENSGSVKTENDRQRWSDRKSRWSHNILERMSRGKGGGHALARRSSSVLRNAFVNATSYSPR